MHFLVYFKIKISSFKFELSNLNLIIVDVMNTKRVKLLMASDEFFTSTIEKQVKNKLKIRNETSL